MSILVERASGRVVGPDFVIEKSFTDKELSKIHLGLFKKSIPTDFVLSDRRITAFADGDHAMCILGRLKESTLLGLTVFIYRQGADWNNWSTKTEEQDLRILTDILVRSNIENGVHLPWGMANAYYDAREGCCYLRIDYVNKYLKKLPEPMPYAPILP
jgi:hypothetical protein